MALAQAFNMFAQPSSNSLSNVNYYQVGLNQYDDKHYNLARQSFEKYIAGTSNRKYLGDAQYYRAICAIKLYHNDGEYLMENFISDFPLHSKSSTARYTIGDYYYQNGKYQKAISNFEQSKNQASLACDLNFKLGYSYLNRKDFENAKSSFSQVTDPTCEHFLAANYYKGYLAYQDDDLTTALTALQTASQDERFGRSAALMIGNIYFRNNNFREAIAFVRGLSPEVMDKNPELYFIRANAHFNKEEYKDAIIYYEKGLLKTRNRASTDIFFNMAETYRKLDQNEKAIEKYKFSALDETEVGAYSSYYLGKLYIETENKAYAKAAFSEALKSEKPIIKEESLYQLAKVDFDLGNFGESIGHLKKYNDEYPDGSYSNESKEFLTKAFLSTSNYDIAISYIESLSSLSEDLKTTYQEVTYLKGTEEFNNRKFSSSVKYFEKSLKHKKSNERTISAHFWMGEAYSIGKLYKEAIKAYKSSLYVTATSSNSAVYHVKARYGLGYAYYNTKDYTNALANFKSYLSRIPAGSNGNDYYIDDARLRLADCFYVTKDYRTAVKTYESLLEGGNSKKDYVFFQLGVVNALQSNNETAKDYYQKVIEGYPSSGYVDNAILQKAEVSFEDGDYLTAIEGFSSLIDNRKQSSLIPIALIKRALAYSNLQQFKKSANDYKYVLDQYVTHPKANDALIGLQEVSTNTGDLDEFNNYLAKFQQANPDDESLEKVEFEAAKSFYFKQLYEQAISAFKTFQDKYNNSASLSEADYYIADSYYRSGDEIEAIPYLRKVVADDQNTYQRRSLDRLGTILTDEEEYEEALYFFKQLENKARNRRELGNAWEGIMSVFFDQKNYDSTLLYVNKITEQKKLSSDLKNKAQLVSGKISVTNKDYPTAEDIYLDLVNGVKDETAAEANYELGKLYYVTKKYKTSLQTLFNLNKQFAQFDEWLGKSFLLIADNYLALDELFQAKATLNSIIEKAEDQLLVVQARQKLSELEEKEKEVIIPKDSTILIDSLNNVEENNND